MVIDFRVIPHAQQRYETVGDYWEDGDTVHFRVSRLSRPEYEWCVFMHELNEYRLCKAAGISLADIDAFDIEYEACREAESPLPCGCAIQEEPGLDKHAPYYWQHKYAERIERIAAEALGVDWVAYDNEISAL